MEGVPPGANMDDQRALMLEEKVSTQPAHIKICQKKHFICLITLIATLSMSFNPNNSYLEYAGTKVAAAERQTLCKHQEIWLCSST
jgi:hypothetical protein